MAILRFDSVRHEYSLDGHMVPSVTKVISNVTEDMMLSNSFLKAGMRGTTVHGICEKINLGEKINIEQLPEDIDRYVRGYLKFVADGKYRVTHSEIRVFSNKYKYAGTLDILADGPKGKALMDIKTSAMISPTTALQLAAYKQAAEEMGILDGAIGKGVKRAVIKERIAIWLTGDGDYELVHFKDLGDWQTFLCFLVTHNWRRKVGLQ